MSPTNNKRAPAVESSGAPTRAEPLEHVTLLGEVAVYPDDAAAERGCWLQMPIEHCIPQEGWR